MTDEPIVVVADLSRRGSRLGGDALLSIGATRLELLVRRGGCDPERVEVRYDDVRELGREGPRGLDLALPRGTRLRIGFADDAATRATEEALLARCCVLPELTRALRSLGRRRAENASASEADRFFEPLLAARRAAAEGGVRDALGAFRGAALAARLEGLAGEFAATRQPQRASARRALEARLCDHLEPVVDALHALDEAAAPLAGTDAVAISAWRAWTARLLAVFERADECWVHLAAELASPAAAPRVSRRPGAR
ncbi:MAG TPA: hypothetical protein VEA99_02710 [Gemmatimonadaceae bacterium]|nr:hypothetical protein [Gemmatimonadaceae bacterium]